MATHFTGRISAPLTLALVGCLFLQMAHADQSERIYAQLLQCTKDAAPLLRAACLLAHPCNSSVHEAVQAVGLS